jgi:hypothetical protein
MKWRGAKITGASRTGCISAASPGPHCTIRNPKSGAAIGNGARPVVSGLIAKRAELAGIIAELQRQLDQHRADLTHIDGVLRILASDLDPETIRPKRVYRRNRCFGRNELSRLCLSVLRTAAGELLSTDDIAGRVIAAKGFDMADGILRVAVRGQVSSVVKRLHRNGTIENIGAGRASKMEAGRRLAGLRFHDKLTIGAGGPVLPRR